MCCVCTYMHDSTCVKRQHLVLNVEDMSRCYTACWPHSAPGARAFHGIPTISDQAYLKLPEPYQSSQSSLERCQIKFCQSDHPFVFFTVTYCDCLFYSRSGLELQGVSCSLEDAVGQFTHVLGSVHPILGTFGSLRRWYLTMGWSVWKHLEKPKNLKIFQDRLPQTRPKDLSRGATSFITASISISPLKSFSLQYAISPKRAITMQ